MQRSSPALFDSPSYSPSKKRSLLRREPHVGDDNDDTRQLLLSACREGGCGHRHHSYTTDNSHSILNNNLTTQTGQGRGTGEAEQRLQKRPPASHHPHYQHHHPRHSQHQHSEQPQQQQQEKKASHTPKTSQAQKVSPTQKAPRIEEAQQKEPQPKPLPQPQPQPQPQPSKQSAQHLLSQPREHVAIRQCSAPTPLYPVGCGPPHSTGPVQQQHSFPEWSRPHGVLPMFQPSGTRPLPLSAAAAAAASSSPSYTTSDDLHHPAAAANTADLLMPRGGDGESAHSNGNGEVAAPLGGEPGGWVLHGQAKAAAFVNSNNTAAATVAADDDMDSQGRSRTPDSPFRSGDDDGLGEDEEDEDDAMMGEVEFSDNVGNHVLLARPPPPQPLLPHDLSDPLHPLPSPLLSHPLATDTSPSEVDEGEVYRGAGRRGGDGNSTSAGGVSLSDDASILSLSDSNLPRSSPSADFPPSRSDLDPSYSQASGDLDPDLSAHSPDLELSHSLSVYETANSRASSSEMAGVVSLPSDARQSPPPHPHAAGGSGGREGGGGPSPGADPDNLLYPDASG